MAIKRIEEATMSAVIADQLDEIERLRKLCLNMGGENAALRAALNDATAITYPPHINDAIHRQTIARAREEDGHGPDDFQARVAPWMQECFGPTISADRIERNHRFLKEALELVQANGCTSEESYQLVDYVFARPSGLLRQEVGGVMVTLAALCLASGTNMHQDGEAELARIWTKIEQIRAKQAAKPKHSPLPAYTLDGEDDHD